MTDSEQPPLMREVAEVIEGNGSIPQGKKDRLMLALMAEIYQDMQPLKGLPDKVQALENKNLIMLACKHPKAAAVIILAVLTLIVAFSRYDPLWVAFSNWLGGL